MDTRAPVEFVKGAFPGTTNLPLLSDSEREQIGICYKQHGQNSAIELGQKLVAGEQRERLIARWCEFANEHPLGYLYCFRGGLRSQTTQRWMREAGSDYPLVTGGYKAMRRFLIEEMQVSVARAGIILIAGKTGTGKTRVIENLTPSVDLEGLACHRGSSFGRLPTPQPSQIDFENTLSVAFLRLLAEEERRVFLEDEGKLIGRISLPEELRDKMSKSPLLVVEEPLEERTAVIFDDYIDDLGRRYAEHAGTAGKELHRTHMLEGLERISKRLGGVLYQQLKQLMEEAFTDTAAESSAELHRAWIGVLLADYYDPMYEYQISRREGAVLFRGTRQEVLSFARELPVAAG